ncbi:MAG: ABC transporter ATP-binding protein, partial [Anaerolineales bacterium]|nr:ABC transporter ATP-binding protein [Anaerolineales bacterium]
NLDISRTIKNLSSGNKQKVGIVQALMHKPDLLLLDEPTAGLDPLMQQEVYRLLREAQAGGSTVFFSSHILSEVEVLAERVAIIRNGLIVEESTPNQLTEMAIRRVKIRFMEPIDPILFTTLEGVKLISSRNGLEAIFEVEGDLDRLIKKLSGFPVKDLETASHSLEDIFLKYYQTEPG